MPFKAVRPPGKAAEIDRWDGGVGWFAYPDETMQRASHALRVDRTDDPDEPADVWVIDPLRAPGVDELLESMGDVVGVVVLLDRHARDAAGFARRYDVPLYLPVWIDIDVPDGIDVVRIEEGLPGTDYDLVKTVDMPKWHEAALFDGQTLVVGDALGTVDYFRTPNEAIGVHPFLRLLPPKPLAGLQPDRILMGHGEGIMAGGGRPLHRAISQSRRGIPRLYFEILRSLITRRFSSNE